MQAREKEMNPLVKEVHSITSSPEDVYVIHCSLATNGNKAHFYPRVSCIYCQNMDSSDSRKFTIEDCAARNNIPVDQITDWYDELENYILADFSSFLNSKSNCVFVYWIETGQELMLDLLKSRFDELNRGNGEKDFQIIPSNNRKSLQFLIGKTHADSKQNNDLKQFIKLHNAEKLIAGFLTPSEERACFDKREYGKISGSVVAKVDFFIRTLNKCAVNSDMASSDKNILPIDLQSMGLLAILKNLNLKSWAFVVTIIVLGFGVGKYFSTDNSEYYRNENLRLKDEFSETERTNTLRIDSLQDTILNLKNQMVIAERKTQALIDSIFIGDSLIKGN